MLSLAWFKAEVCFLERIAALIQRIFAVDVSYKLAEVLHACRDAVAAVPDIVIQIMLKSFQEILSYVSYWQAVAPMKLAHFADDRSYAQIRILAFLSDAFAVSVCIVKEIQ